MRLKQSLAALLVFSLALLLPCAAGAQTQTAPEGVTWGDYNVQQSIEFGYRFSNDWQHGNFRTFDNFVNLHEGPRLLENTLSMRSLSHDAPLFDNLFISTFGFGGDPNNVARVKVSKNKWYNFSSSFRRDQNFFDYPLLGNPLNTPVRYGIPAYGANSLVAAGLASATATNFPTPQSQDSAHPLATRRRMSDFDLTILPQSIVTLRLGYSRNRITGPAFTSFHEGTDFIIGGNGDNANTTDNTYRIGADIKLLPKTTISYDQTFDYYKNDTDYALGPNGFQFSTVPLTAAQTKTGIGAVASGTFNFGLPFFGNLNRPCQNFFVNTAGQVNPNCSGLYLINPTNGLPGYFMNQRVRTKTPSEQLSFVSRAIKNVDLSGRYIYSSADMTNPYKEDFYGAVTRTYERRWGFAGTSTAKSVNNAAEFSATIHLTDKARVIEIFRFNAWRTPVFQVLQDWSAVSTSAPSGGSTLPGTGGASGFTPFLLMPAVGCVGTSADPLTQCDPSKETVFGVHASSGGADLGKTTLGGFLGQNAKWNTVSLEYDFFKQFGARLGYRYGTKRDSEKSGYELGQEFYYPNAGAVTTRLATCSAVLANNVCRVDIAEELSEPEHFDVTEHTALFGLWLRPSHDLRMNGELELSSFDAAVTRVSPRHQQHYRFRTTWKPISWAVLSATYNGIESTNQGAAVPTILPANFAVQSTSTVDIGYKGHNRNLGFSASVTPNAKIAFDVAYNYNDFKQSALVCPVYTSGTAASTGFAASVVPNLPVCPLFPDQVGNGVASSTVGGKVVSSYNLQNGNFNSTNHFISFFVTVKPVKRFTTQFGYSLSDNDGNMLVMSPWLGVGTPTLNSAGYFILPNTYGAPSTLASKYHMPTVAFSYELVKNWTAKAQWNYWGYNEGTTATGSGLSNNFHANMGLVSIRYAF